MKTFNRLGIEKNFLNLVKGIYEKSPANILDGEAESCPPQDQERHPLSPLLGSTVLEVLSRIIEQEKK